MILYTMTVETVCIHTTVLKCTLHGFQDTLYATFFFTNENRKK